MISISYDEWKSCVEGFFKRRSTLKRHLQLYPLYNISPTRNNDSGAYQRLLDECFFNTYIKTGLFLIDEDTRRVIRAIQW